MKGFAAQNRWRHGILALLLVFGCLERGAVTIEEPPGTVVCRRGPECDAKWQRALACEAPVAVRVTDFQAPGGDATLAGRGRAW